MWCLDDRGERIIGSTRLARWFEADVRRFVVGQVVSVLGHRFSELGAQVVVARCLEPVPHWPASWEGSEPCTSDGGVGASHINEVATLAVHPFMSAVSGEVSSWDSLTKQNGPPEDIAEAGLAAIVGKLQGLKPFPEAAQRLLLLVWDPEHDADAVVEIIQSDPSLTARVLRLINSGVFGLRHRCESVRRSVVLLGSEQVAQVAVAQLALDQFDGTGKLGKQISDHCRLVGNLCRKLGARRPRLRNVDVYTPGMLHDLGKLLLLQVDQGEYLDVVMSAPAEPDALHALERSRFGYDHAVLADRVMEQWKLPVLLREVIRLHHDWDTARAGTVGLRESVAVLRLADRLSYELIGDPVGDPEKLELIAASPEAQTLELDTHRLAQLWPQYFELLGGV